MFQLEKVIYRLKSVNGVFEVGYSWSRQTRILIEYAIYIPKISVNGQVGKWLKRTSANDMFQKNRDLQTKLAWKIRTHRKNKNSPENLKPRYLSRFFESKDETTTKILRQEPRTNPEQKLSWLRLRRKICLAGKFKITITLLFLWIKPWYFHQNSLFQITNKP